MTRTDRCEPRRPGRSWPHTLVAITTGALLFAARTSFAQGVSLAPIDVKVDVRIERPMVTMTYDLVWEDPSIAYDVSLVVTDAAGHAVDVKTASVSGDLGRVATPGLKKKVTWDAGQELGSAKLDQFTYKITAAPVVRTGDVVVQTDPAGATVSVVDEERGSAVAPVAIVGLRIGPHTIKVTKEGYLPSQFEVQIEEGKMARVSQALTLVPLPEPVSQVPARILPTAPTVKLPRLPKRGTFLGAALTQARRTDVYGDWGYTVDFAQDIATTKWMALAAAANFAQGLSDAAWSLTGGMRVAGKVGRRFRPFVQFLIGRSIGFYGLSTYSSSPNFSTYSYFSASNSPLLAPGAGAEVLLGHRVNLHLAVDLLRYRGQTETVSNTFDPVSGFTSTYVVTPSEFRITRLSLGLTVAIKRPR